MSIRIPYLCWIVRHKRDRKRAWFDGMDWRSNCIHCEISMIRGAHGWRPFLPSDYSANRDSKDVSRLESLKQCNLAVSAAKTASEPVPARTPKRGERRPGARDLLQAPGLHDPDVQKPDPQAEDGSGMQICSEAVAGSTYRQSLITAAG